VLWFLFDVFLLHHVLCPNVSRGRVRGDDRLKRPSYEYTAASTARETGECLQVIFTCQPWNWISPVITCTTIHNDPSGTHRSWSYNHFQIVFHHIAYHPKGTLHMYNYARHFACVVYNTISQDMAFRFINFVSLSFPFFPYHPLNPPYHNSSLPHSHYLCQKYFTLVDHSLNREINNHNVYIQSF
jgi:hypothetical protein